MDLYCQSCDDRKPMRAIRRPRYGRPAALVLVLAAAVAAAVHLFWPFGPIGLAAALALAFFGRNYWECEACGTLTNRE
jgi:hypothetical protein